jgi:hypothetical protein
MNTDPDIIFAMDNLGRTTQRVDAAGTWTMNMIKPVRLEDKILRKQF